MTEPVLPTTDQTEPTWPERTAFGAVWRGVVVLLFSLAAVPAGAWAGTKISEAQVAGVAMCVPALVVVALVVGWLRARDAFVVMALYGSLTATFACARLLGKGYVSSHRPYLADAFWATFAAAVTAVGCVVLVVAVVWGTVSGFRRPRPYKPKDGSVSHQ